MKKILIFLFMFFVCISINGCGENKEKKAEKVFIQAKQYFENEQYSSCKPLLVEYQSLVFNGQHKNQVDRMLHRINFVGKNEKLVSECTAKLKLPNSNAVNYSLVDMTVGSVLQVVALHVDNPTKESFILSIDKFDKQSTGSHIIYFVKDTDYKIINKKELAHKVLAVYASTTGLLQILDVNGKVAEEIKMI